MTTRTLALCTVVIILAACRGEETPYHTVIPRPAISQPVPADTFVLDNESRIVFDEGDEEAERIGRYLASLIGNTVETTPAVEGITGAAPDGVIYLTRAGQPSAPGAPMEALNESYSVEVTSERVTIAAPDPAGLFYGAQTLRQLLPPRVEYTAAFSRPMPVAGIRIEDQPRFGWRGAMLDVSRHFFPVDDVKGFIDLMALYKLNRLHLHLSDDQGWRIEIPSWPNLTEYGGSTEVGGGEGGFYTVEEYRDIVAHAAEHFITVVPEIDMPGHINAALASYPELNCDGEAPDLYTGIAVGFSALCVEKDITYQFLDDVIGTISELTPGPWFHMGGDEVEELTEEEYAEFYHRVEAIVASHGKRMIGWDEVAMVNPGPTTSIQLWRPWWSEGAMFGGDSAQTARVSAFQDAVQAAAERGSPIIMSPADHIYLDMKYDSTTAIGLTWGGLHTAKSVYTWRVDDVFPNLPTEALAGVESPFWSETLGTMDDVEQLAFPRLVGVAEFGWTPAEDREWGNFRTRLQAHMDRWVALGVNYHRGELPQ